MTMDPISLVKTDANALAQVEDQPPLSSSVGGTRGREVKLPAAPAAVGEFRTAASCVGVGMFLILLMLVDDKLVELAVMSAWRICWPLCLRPQFWFLPSQPGLSLHSGCQWQASRSLRFLDGKEQGIDS